VSAIGSTFVIVILDSRMHYKRTKRRRTLQTTWLEKPNKILHVEFYTVGRDPHGEKLNSVGLGNVKSLNPITADLDDLNDYFVSVVPSPCNSTKSRTLAELDTQTNLIQDNISFDFQEVTSQDVQRALTSIKSKASGYDGVDITMIRISLAWFLPIITHIFNKSLSSGKFPDFWKFSNIIPLNKVASPSSCVDYRPISLLPVLSKRTGKDCCSTNLGFH
jgi:hypothetical protein